MVRCRTVDLEVPAESEVVLEGYVDATDLRPEGPFGDHTGFYTPVDDYPTFHVTGMSMRRDAIYSHHDRRAAADGGLLPRQGHRAALPADHPHDAARPGGHEPARWRASSTTARSSRCSKRYPGHAKKLMSAIWGLGLLSLSRCVVVVDHDVDVQDVSAVAFQAFSNVDAGRDMLVVEGPVDALDHAAPYFAYGVEGGLRRDPQVGGRGRRAAVAGRHRDERRGPRPRRPPVGRVRDRSPRGQRDVRPRSASLNSALPVGLNPPSVPGSGRGTTVAGGRGWLTARGTGTARALAAPSTAGPSRTSRSPFTTTTTTPPSSRGPSS